MVRWLHIVLDSPETEDLTPSFRPKVRTLTSPEGFTAIREALTWLATERPSLFAQLYGPHAGPAHNRPSVQSPSPPGTPVEAEAAAPIWVSETLFNHGLLEKRGRGGGGGVVGTVAIRRLGPRFYLQSLGLLDGAEYRHEIWPETDALLAALPAEAARRRQAGRPSCGRLCDLGTGSGIVAIEARVLGFDVVAIDDDPVSMLLADFNAKLNGVEDLVLRRGSMFTPITEAEDRLFDVVVSNPDYGGVRDLMRLEVLRAASAEQLLAPDGVLLVATMLEWQDQLPCEVPLGELVVAGFAVTVAPIVSSAASADKDDWFAVVAPGSVAGIPSRHRFTIRVARCAVDERPALRIKLPDVTPRDFVPLSALARSDQHAVIATVDDVQALVALSAQLDAPELVFEGLIPDALVDGCRFGAQPCVGPFGAAGAIVHGISIRPCAHGDAVGSTAMTMAELTARYEQLDRELQVRRNCPSCRAYSVCSRCLFTGPLPEATYCEVVRQTSSGPSPRAVLRLIETRQFFDQQQRQQPNHQQAPLRILRGPMIERSDDDNQTLTDLARRWRRRSAWAVERGGDGYLQLVVDGRLDYYPMSALELDVVLLLVRGGAMPELAAAARRHAAAPGQVALAVTRLMDRLGV